MFADRLSITSPGSLDNGISLEKTRNFLSLASRRRNQVISETFVLCKAMEAKGTGIEKIEENYRGSDEGHKPFIHCRDNQFSIALPDLTNPSGVDLSSDDLIVYGERANQNRFSLPIMSFCFGKERTSKEISDRLGASDSTYFRQSVLETPVKQGFLSKTFGRRGKR